MFRMLLRRCYGITYLKHSSNGCELCTKSQMPESQSIECFETFFEVPVDICSVYWQTALGQGEKIRGKKGTHTAGENHTKSM